MSNSILTKHFSRTTIASIVLGCLFFSILSHADQSVEKGFNRYVGEAITRVVFRDNYEFILLKGNEPSFLIYDTNSKLKQFQCERASQYEFLAHANKLGAITIGECSYTDIFSLKNLKNQKILMEKMAKRLVDSMPGNNASNPFRSQFQFNESILPDRSTFYRFNITAVGHGILFYPIAIVVPENKSKVLVIQYSTYPLCDRQHIKNFSLCVDANNTVRELAIQLFGADSNVYRARMKGGEMRKLYLSEEYDKCITTSSNLIAIDPTYTSAYLYKARCYRKSGRYGEALENLKKAHAMAPGSSITVRELAWFYATARDSKYQDGLKSKHYIANAIELRKKRNRKVDGRYQRILAAAHARTREYEKAVEYQEQALAEYKKRVDRIVSRGTKYIEKRGINMEHVNQKQVALKTELEKYKNNRPHSE